MSEEFYNRLAVSEEGNRTVLNNVVEGRSHSRACQYSVQGNVSQSTATTSRPCRIDNRVERTEVNLHLKHRPQRRAGSDSNSRGRYRANEHNRHIANVDGERRTCLSSSGIHYEDDERISVSYSGPNECDGTALDAYMPEIPRAAPTSIEQPVVVGREDASVCLERMSHYGGSEWKGASINSPLVTYGCEAGSFGNYAQPSGKQAQLCPHVKGQQSLIEDNNNVSCVSFGDRDDKRYSPSKHHIGNHCDRYIYHPEIERQYKSEHSNNGPPSYYYGIQTENMMRWKNAREKNSRQIPGSSYGNEKAGKSVSKTRYASDRNVNSSDSESGPSSSEREYWPNTYCSEKRKKRVRRKTYRSKHYLGESDPSEHSDPGHRRFNEEISSHICCTSSNGDRDYEQQRSRSSVHLLNNRRNISRSLTSVSSLDEDSSLRGGFTFNRISPRGKGMARISKVNIKSFSTIHANPNRVNRATSSTSDIGNLEVQARLYGLEKNAIKTTSRKTVKEKPSMTAEQSDSSCTSPSLKKSPFNAHLVRRKSSTSGSETPTHTPTPRICSPELVDDRFQAPQSSSFKTINASGSDNSNRFLHEKEEPNTSPGDNSKVLKSMIENLEKDDESENETVALERPDFLPLQSLGSKSGNTQVNVATSPDSAAESLTAGGGLFLTSENNSQLPLSPGGINRVSSFPFGKDTLYTIQKPFVTLANIQEQDEAVYNSDGNAEHVKRKKDVLRKKTSTGSTSYNDENAETIFTSPRRRPSYVIAQNSGQMSPASVHEKPVEGNRTKPNGKEQPIYDELAEKNKKTSGDAVSSETNGEHVAQEVFVLALENELPEVKETKTDGENVSDNGSSRKRTKKMERPRIPTILSLDEALDQLFHDVKNKPSDGE